jgi:hypothetical protein
MSHFNDFKTEMTDKEALVRALCRADYRAGTLNRAHIECHDTPASLYGYQNDKREQKAHVIIRRNHVGSSSNDMGFVQDESGRYKAIISDFDQSHYNQQWLGKLTTYYNVEKSKMELDAKGITYTESVDTQGRIQLRAKFKADVNASRIQVKR